MKMCIRIIGLVVLFAPFAFGETTDLRKELEAAAATSGPAYFAARSNLIQICSNAVPQLQEIVTNTNEPWQVRLMAGIIRERVEKGKEIDALIKRDWRNDPEFDPAWNGKLSGALHDMSSLAIKRYKEAGLWFYYVEFIWKATQEHAVGFKKDEPVWRRISRDACKDSSVYEYLVKVLEERVRNDIGFKKYETRGELFFLINNATSVSLPFLLDVLPHLPLNDEQSRMDFILSWIKSVAQPQDTILFERYFKDKEQDVPEILKEPLQKLKDRQQKPEDLP